MSTVFSRIDGPTARQSSSRLPSFCSSSTSARRVGAAAVISCVIGGGWSVPAQAQPADRPTALAQADPSAQAAQVTDEPAQLAQAAGQARSLAPVVIGASRLEQGVGDALPHTTVITEREIRESGQLDLPSLLRVQGGVDVVQSGGPGAPSTPFLRGAEGRQVLVLIDGVRVSSATLGATALEHLMLDQFERIEIVRGNVSALYGSGAVGGVIQLFTRRGRGTPRPSLGAEFGSYGTQRLRAGYGGQIGDTSFDIGLSHLRTDGFSAINPAIAPTVNPDRDGYRNGAVSASLSHRIDPRHEVGARYFQTEGRSEYDTPFALSPREAHRVDTRLSTLSAYLDSRPVESWRSRLTVASGGDRSSNRIDSSVERFETTQHQFGWQNDVTLAPGHVLTATLEHAQQRVESTTLYERTRRRINSLQAGYSGQFGAHQVQASLRHDRFSDFGLANSYLLGYGYRIDPSWKLIGTTSTAFNAPTFNQLYFPNFGNPALDPERARSVEVGGQYERGGVLGRLVWFRTRYRDLIDFPPPVFAPVNIARAEVQGIELSVSGEIAGWRARLALTVQDPVDETTGQTLRRRAKAFGGIDVSREFGPWRVGGDIAVSGGRPDRNIVTDDPLQLSGYTLVNLQLRYRWRPGLDLTARLANALDEKYSTAHGYMTAGRAIYAGIAWQP